MQVLVIGSGGREHTLVWKLLQSPEVTQVYCAPGNAGIGLLSKCQTLPLSATDIAGLLRFASVQGIGLTIVGPEVALAAGIVDAFQEAGIPIFGPTQAGAQIESSKAWAKALMISAGIPTASAKVFQDLAAATAYVQQHALPIVIKADGLAAGKGVTVAETQSDALIALQDLFDQAIEGTTVVVEDFLVGEEASVLAVCDGYTCLPLLPAQDHKRIGEGDTGANTGGMGAYAPASHLVTDAVMAKIQSRILDPTLAALREQGILYRGVLYAGVMVDPSGDPYVVEFNCRFGDPETQVILPLLENSLVSVLLACLNGTLDSIRLQWQNGSAACVVMSAPGYPGNYPKGLPIRGLDAAPNSGALVFHAGTKWSGSRPRTGEIVTDGGRVLCITGRGTSLPAALAQAYAGIAALDFDLAYYRRDIGHRALTAMGVAVPSGEP